MDLRKRHRHCSHIESGSESISALRKVVDGWDWKSNDWRMSRNQGNSQNQETAGNQRWIFERVFTASE